MGHNMSLGASVDRLSITSTRVSNLRDTSTKVWTCGQSEHGTLPVY